MKQRKTFAIVLTIILILATVLTVFAAFRFEVQFPSKLNTYTYDETTAKFAGTYSFDADLTQLQEPGQGAEFAATVTGDANTPLTYVYTISVDGYSVNDITILDADDDATKTAKSEKIALLSSVFVKLNDKIVGTLYSVIKDHAGLLGEGLYVLPGATENDTLRLELHLASDATPYENASLKVTVNCTATNHNAQKLTFVKDASELIQAISEVNRGAADKTIVMYGGFEVPANLEVQKPCTFDVQDVTFAGPIAVNITSAPVDGVPTDIVTVLSTKSTCTAASGFSITAGAIDRKDSASNVAVTVGAGANTYSIQYILDNQIASVEAHGIAAGQSIDFSGKGFLCYIESIDAETGSLLSYADNKLTAGNTEISTVEKVTITLATADNATHTHNIKVIGKGDEAAALFEENGDLYYLTQLAQPGIDVSYSIPLPTVLKNKNATIEWHSSDPEKFSNQGVCSPSANGYVTLTAVIRINEDVYTHDVKIHIATLTNKDRLEAMIAAMGNITLSKLYPSTATGNVNGLIDGNYGDLPMAGTTTGGYEQYIKFAIPTQDDQGNPITEQQITTFDISGLTYSIDKATYGYIDVVDIDANAEDDVSQNVVVLKQSTFNTLAEVQVTATFETGDSSEETSIIYVNIELGENKDLGDQVLAYVRNKLSEVNVLQNMLDTRVAGAEKGDFELPTEYSGFDIVYRINSDSDKNIISTIDITTDAAGNAITDTELLKKNAGIVENGQFEINAEGFKNVAHDVTVTVSVLIKGTHTISTGNVISSADMTFTVPAAIHCDNDRLGFNDETLFQSVRKQVMEQATPAYSKNGDAFVDADKNYILVRDIENCTTLIIDGNGVNDTNINGLAYFENLTSFEASNFDASFASQLSRAASTFKKLTHLKLSYVGLTDISPVLDLDLNYLDVSGNAGLKDISGIAKLDATKLGYLNISGTAVDMELTRSLLTAMYYRYEAKNNTAPEYYYTHEYTPIADGALLLEPDAISVTTENGTTTATIGGSELLINGATYDATNKIITVGESNTAISIDGKKSISVKAGTEITVLKGENHSSGDSVMLNDAIISFELESGMKSESFQIADLWLSGTVTISNATVSGNIITVGAGGSLVSTVDGEDMELNQGTIPVLSGIITTTTVEGNPAVVITPLKYTADNDGGNVNNVGNYRNEGLTDDGTNTIIGHTNMTEIVISGASVNGTNVIVGANGGTITVKIAKEGQDPIEFTFAVRSNTTIQADTAGTMIKVNADGTISILPITQNQISGTANEVIFSNATIENVSSNGTATPTIQVEAGSTMTINGSTTLILPSAIQMPLPANAVGKIIGDTVAIQTYNKAGIASSYSGSQLTFSLLNVTRSTSDAPDGDGWHDSNNSTFAFTPRAIFTTGNNSYLMLDNGTVWIPLSSNTQINLTGNTWSFWEQWDAHPEGYWGTIVSNNTTGITQIGLTNESWINGSINLTTGFTSTANTATFSIAALPFNQIASAKPEATLPTESINPIYSGIRTTLPNATQSIAPNVVDYFGENLEFFGCTLSGNTVTPNAGYKWYAILIDGEYVTISDGATVTVTGTTGNYQVTVTNGTSTIGKGALVTKTDVNVTPLIGSAANPTGIFAISNGAESPVKVTYQNIGADDGLVLAIIDDIRFEPIVANNEEKAGVNILFLLSEVPSISHYDYNKGQNNAHGTYVQLTPVVHYGNGGYSVSITWSVDAASMAYVAYADYYGSPRLETVRPENNAGLTFVDGVAEKEITVIAQVNVQGVVSTRYFTFTVTYYNN